MGFWSNLLGKKATPVATGGDPAPAVGTSEARSVPCPACGQANAVARAAPPFGTAVICSNCKASLIRVADPNQRPYTPPREVALFLGYQGCSLLHARCPSCREVNYSVLVPEKGYATSFYWNRQQENPNAAYVVNVKCPHCERPYVIEWDEDPR